MHPFPTDFKIPSLIGLAIHNNVYDQYPETFISSMVKLQNLSIDVFDGSKFGSGLMQSRNLSRIDFFQRSGSPFYFRNDSFLAFNSTKITNLEIQWFIYNSASCVEVGVFSPFHHLRRFRFITQKCNIRQVLRALYGLQGLQMEYLNLAYNFDQNDEQIPLDDEDIRYLSTICVKQVDLTRSKISKLPYKISDSRFAQCLEEILIGHNNFRGIDMLPVAFMLSYNKIRKLDFSSNMLALQEQQENVSVRRRTSWNWTNRTINVTITFPDSLQMINISRSFSGKQLVIKTPTGINFQIVAKGSEIWDLSYTELPYCQTQGHFTFVTSIKTWT